MGAKVDSGRCVRMNVICEPGCAEGSPRVREVCWTFGIAPREGPAVLAEDLTIPLRPGTIVLVSGPSGSGKSSLLRGLVERLQRAVQVSTRGFSRLRAVVDGVAPRRPLATALELLTACGLGEPRLWLRRFADLSDGERFRAALARAVGRAMAGGSQCEAGVGQGCPILCDEFAGGLHARLARALAYNLRRLVTRRRLTLVVGTTRGDLGFDLQPDVVIRLGDRRVHVSHETVQARPCSLAAEVFVESGCVEDYRDMAAAHYRQRDGLGFVDRVFVLREREDGDRLGVAVYAHAPKELALRNRATEGRFVRDVARLNRELRILRRLVIHPDVRGCGLGHWFVRQTLPMAGVRFVECLAAMGGVNPVFERAGMARVGRCGIPRGRVRLVERMRALGVDPLSPDFARRIGGFGRVREMVERTIKRWVATTGGTKFAVERRTPADLARLFRQLVGEPPVYYLWDKDGEFPRARDGEMEDGSARTRVRRPARKTRERRHAARDRHDPRA